MVTSSRRLMPHVRAIVFAAGLALLAPMAAHAAPHNDGAKAYDESDKSKEPHVISGQHVEGHIAYLHAELGITPDQEALWKTVADAMREDVRDMQNAERSVADQYQGHETAIQYLRNRTMFANLRADGEVRFLNAMEPLYGALSPDQQKIADDILIPSDSDQ